jgi:hypothetical protein
MVATRPNVSEKALGSIHKPLTGAGGCTVEGGRGARAALAGRPEEKPNTTKVMASAMRRDDFFITGVFISDDPKQATIK